MLLTGDLAADGRPEEYRRLCAVLAASPVPMLAVPGNHDHRETFARELAGSAILTGDGPGLWLERDDGPVRLIGLDTLGAAGSDVGLLGDAQRAWVADRLGRDDPRPVLIFMHHPPFPVGLPLDWTRCADGDDARAAGAGAPAGAGRGLRAPAPRRPGRLGGNHRRRLPAGRLGGPARPAARSARPTWCRRARPSSSTSPTRGSASSAIPSM